MQVTTTGFEQCAFVPAEQPRNLPTDRMPEYEQIDNAPKREELERPSSIDKTLMRTLHGIKDAQLGVEFRDYVSVRRGLKFAMNSIEYVQTLLRAGGRVDGIATPESVKIEECIVSIQELKRKILMSNVMALSLEKSKLIHSLQKGLLNQLSKTLTQSEDMLGILSDRISGDPSYSWV